MQDNSAAIATGDLGNIAAAAGGSIGSLTGDDALGKTIATAGQAADGALDTAEDDDLAGVFNSVAKGTTLIPGVGDQISTGLEAAGDITKSAKEGDTAGIVGDLGGALGKLVPGPAGGIISTLSPAAESATGSLIKGDLAGGINSGLSGIGSVIPNGQAVTAIQAAT